VNCRDFEDALAGVLVGDEAPEEAAPHLRDCASCRTRARQMFRLHEALLQRLAPVPDSLERTLQPLLDQVESDLRAPSEDLVEAARERIRKLPRQDRRSPFGFRIGVVAAAVLALAASVAIYLSRDGRDPAPEARRTLPNPPKPGPTPPAPEEFRELPKNEPPRPKESPSPVVEHRSEPKSSDAAATPKAPPEPERPRDVAPPEPAPAPKAAPSPTVVAAALLEQVSGSVFVLTEGAPEKIPARAGLPLACGQMLMTDGPGSLASISQASGTTFRVEPDTKLSFSSPAELSLAQGRVALELAKAPTEPPLSLVTPHARIQAARGRFILHARPESTFFEVRVGSAQFTNLRGGAAQSLQAGQFAAAPLQPGVTQEQIDKAIRDGIEFLKKAPSPPFTGAGIANSDTLILLTLLHAGVPESDARFQQMLQDMLKAPIDRTYVAAVQAMVLEELDRVKYQPRIVACAQVIVDNQCRNGQWSYGTASPAADAAFVDPRPDVATAAKLDAAGRRIKPKLTKKVAIRKTREGPPTGDNSNAQYAALGLRACYDSGVMIPAEVLHLASRWWRESQFADAEDRKNAYGGRGWCYFDGKGKVNGGDCCKYTYAAMTAGAVGSLVILDHLLGKDWKSDANVRLGTEWLTTNFSVTHDFKWGKEIPGDPENQGAHFYYLYALERLGTFIAQEKFGRHEWYPEGAAVIVERQRPDGSWMDIDLGNFPVWDTCFSILFLRRATRPLDVPSVDKIQKR
jgi:ferric-dicitrate binding protein FerR (iron transport regulator)